MIRINLAKPSGLSSGKAVKAAKLPRAPKAPKAPRVPRVPRVPPRAQKAPPPPREPRAPKVKKHSLAGPVFFLLLLLAAGVGGGAYYYINYFKPAEEAKKAEQALATASLPPPVPNAEIPEAKPSSQIRTTMVESVVKEFNNDGTPAADNKLSTPYAEMAVPEKVNYEVLFARNVFEMVTRCTPPGIRLKSLEVDNFQIVYANGSGAKPMVEEMFATFKNERGELMPKPYSHIKDDESGNFVFTITYKPNFGLQVGDPFQALEQITFKEGLTQHLKNFSRLAGDSNFKMSAAPSQLTASKAGSYRRVVYKAVGMTNYGDFHKFVLALYNERVPCAFKKITMTPVRDEQIRVTAEVLFSVKE
ncbi:MAG: hypothetical protein LBH93_06645 [Chitinispirillales bacterium]|jgi:hypothetical protein|nr:hypothetical protein [Chitinispirillales bacterium]